ncbi:hypothetical protein [Actinokineospora sp.]|uniref:hypothetical protein n=1 Tax=Actinokineospora sp. TaxID=1872133 RepID=UPI0040382C3F
MSLQEIVDDLANQLDSTGNAAAADYVRSNGPEQNPALWESKDADAILRQLIDGHLQEAHQVVSAQITTMVENIAEARAGSDSGEDAAEDGDAFGWVTSDQRGRLEEIFGTGWPDEVNTRLTEAWGADYQTEYDGDGKSAALDSDFIPLWGMPFTKMTDAELAEYLDTLNSNIYNDMLGNDILQDIEDSLPGLIDEVYLLVSQEMAEIAQQGLAEQDSGL